jgi:hypothetical protein
MSLTPSDDKNNVLHHHPRTNVSRSLSAQYPHGFGYFLWCVEWENDFVFAASRCCVPTRICGGKKTAQGRRKSASCKERNSKAAHGRDKPLLMNIDALTANPHILKMPIILGRRPKSFQGNRKLQIWLTTLRERLSLIYFHEPSTKEVRRSCRHPYRKFSHSLITFLFDNPRTIAPRTMRKKQVPLKRHAKP